ncbi:hypothetical protein BU23DRAFT_564338 [Bimuria novae-zelandiae CBS 107.79]|uniref:Uncharacterized protein n=1 Tax=Bimuria novae-zelandiae CBS 107.79 TaxID=1447943 RepID=A0A6A5VMY5_9PLEO|nr:hypothetical protein BU23DRAFT_564338 [Bimuria novae-zelandiae CBS 107.79]
MSEMPYNASGYPAALLATFVLGNILSTEAAGCNSEPISTGGDGHLELLSSAIREACAEWSQNNNKATTFDSAPFKLSFAGTIETTDNDSCVSAFATIIENCAGDVIFGGFTASQGIDYAIDGAKTDPRLHSELVARGRARGGSRASRKKVPRPKAPVKPKKKTPAKPKKKTPAKPKKKTPAKPKKKTEKSKACKAKSDKKGKKPGKGAKAAGRKPLTGRAILLDLIKRVNGKGKQTDKGNGKDTGKKDASKTWGSRKHYKYGDNGKFLVSDTYPGQNALPKNVEQFGSSTEKPLKEMFGHKDDLDQAEVAAQDVEHVLEWHNVGGFLEAQYGTKIEQYLPTNRKELEGEEGCPDQFEITVEGKKHTGTLSKVIAQAYPGTKHLKEEFLLLDKYPNEHIKQDAFSNQALVSEDNFKGNELLRLHDVLIVGEYLVHPKVNEIFGKEVTRMGEAMGAIEKQLAAKGKTAKTRDGLENAWKAHMSKIWGSAETRLTNFMDEKIKALKKDFKCSDREVKIQAQGTVEEPNEKDAPKDMKEDPCASLKFIHDKWISIVKDHLNARPWEKSSTPAASTGDKRPKLNQKPSDADSHNDKKQEQGSESTSGAN